MKLLLLLPKLFLWSCLALAAIIFFPFALLSGKKGSVDSIWK